jgi:hypothetical protein
MRSHSGDCCSSQGPALSVAERRVLGERRRLMVRRSALTASVTLCAAGLTGLLFWPSTTLADRALWAAALCAAGLAGGWIRLAMVTHRPGWRLVLAAAAAALGIAWHPVLPALAAIAALAESLCRPAPAASSPASTGTLITNPGR